MSVRQPTSTPGTSAMGLSGPGVPSKGTPRSRARGRVWVWAVAATDAKKKAASNSGSFVVMNDLSRGSEFLVDLLQQRCIFFELRFEDFFLLIGALPVAGLGSFGEARQFEMRVRVTSRIQRMFEPGAAGNAVWVAPVALDLHELGVDMCGGGSVELAVRDRDGDRLI